VAGTTTITLPSSTATLATNENFTSTGIDDNATSTAITIDSSENVSIDTGNLVIGTSGKGIDFSATSDGSGTMTSELLDDYEEGTWTPGIEGGTTAGTGTYSSASGRYTKVGNLVTCIGYINMTAHTGAGVMNLTGLPFTQVNDSATITMGAMMVNDLTYTGDQILLIGSSNLTTLRFYSFGNETNWGPVSIDTAFRTHFQFTYMT